MRQINQAGFDLIKSFEGFSVRAYQDVSGVWTIGYGHTKNVTENSPDITQDEAQILLMVDLEDAETEVEHLVAAHLNDNQFSALVSLVFNVGIAPLLRGLGQKLKLQDYAGAADEFLKWNHSSGIVIDGLTRRRKAERNLFLSYSVPTFS